MHTSYDTGKESALDPSFKISGGQNPMSYVGHFDSGRLVLILGGL
jgi:hypothetical protein